MKKTVRKAVIAGNWKMNKTRPEAKALLEELKPMVADVKDVEVVACVPFTNLETALAVTAGTNIKIGAENCLSQAKFQLICSLKWVLNMLYSVTPSAVSTLLKQTKQ